MDTIGKYPVVQVLGNGGTATVYAALDEHGRSVAVKLLSPGFGDTPALRARFLREAQAAGVLAHANVARVLDVGEHEGRPFVVTEMVPGVDLEQAARSSRPYPVVWVLDVLRQLCLGLAHAHRNGLLHRDLKPSDIRVTPGGQVKVLDFGIANLKSFARPESLPGLASLHYRAPEQVEGRRSDRRTDVYAVGAILYELLARRKPFPADSATGVLRQITHDVPDPSALPATAFSPRLEAFVMKALARRPEDRFDSVDEMYEELVTLVREAAPRLRVRSAVAAAASPGAGDEARRKEVERLRSELAQVREEGQAQRALELCQRLLELEPEDEDARRTASELEAAMQEREAEQLCGMALAYAADGDLEIANKIAERIERLTPWSPRYLQLQVYLDEEAARRTGETLTAAAREHLAEGRLRAALAAVDEVLATDPSQPSALEIRKTVIQVLEAQRKAAGDEEMKRREALEAEVEVLTSRALDHFVRNDHPGAQRAVEDALALDPENRKALELLKILGALG